MAITPIYAPVFFFSFLNVLGFALLLIRLLWTRLAAVYPWFFLYVLTDIVEQVGRVIFPSRNVEVFQAGEGVRLVLAIAVLWELVRLGFHGHAAVGAFIRKGSWYIIAVSVAVSFLNWALDPPLQAGRSLAYHEFIALERAVTSGLFVYLVTVLLFMGWFPVKMRRNVVVLMMGFVAYFAARWVQQLGGNVSLEALNWVNLFENALALVCAGAWMMLVDRPGEQAETVTGHRWNPREMERLSRKLDAINASLVRMGQ